MYSHSLIYFLYMISVISTSLANPILPRDHSKITRVPTQRSPKNGVIALSKTYSKYGWKLPPGVASSLASQRQSPDGTDPLPEINEKASNDDENSTPNLPADPAPSTKASGTKTGKVSATLANSNSEYLCPVQIGSQTLHLNLDTGSSDFWVFSTELESHERGSHTLYKPPTANHIKGASFNVNYGDETSLTGSVAWDTVSIGGVGVDKQAVELPTEFSTGILEDPSDGILGLGFGRMNSVCSSSALTPAVEAKDKAGPATSESSGGSCPQGYVPNPRPTWFENAKKALKEGVFTANLKHGTAGYYNFGSIDHTAYKGDEVHYVAVDNSKGFWGFEVGGYRVGDGKDEKKDFPNVDNIADSGSSLMMMEPQAVVDYYGGVEGAIEGDGGWSFPCDAVLPDFRFSLGDGDGGYEVVVEGKVINYAPTSDGKKCYGGIQSNDGQGPQIFGDIMFKSQFVVFDYDNLRIGFAPHA